MTQFGIFGSVSKLSKNVIERLAEADAFRSIGLDRREALWAAQGLEKGNALERLPLFDSANSPNLRPEPDVELPPMPLGEQVTNDYNFLRLSLKAHPVSLVRTQLNQYRIKRNDELANCKTGQWLEIAGLITVRQRPGTAKGVLFLTLEDETGVANGIVWPKIFKNFALLYWVLGLFDCLVGYKVNQVLFMSLRIDWKI